ncbi:MAG: ABC transporter ATP-binding protein [Eubacteriales bacterium]
MATDIVTVTNLSKRYGDFTTVNNISFSIRPGEIFGFLGPNGAGKTTTINMMIGLARPTGGSIFIDGIDAVKNIKKAQAVMGIVPDESNLYDEMDGFENLCFCGSLYGIRKQAREKRAMDFLAQFDLIKVGKRPFKAYSKGMRRKLTIVAGIIHNPRILFLDEPTTGIDVESARQIRQLLLNFKKSGITIFITTHYIEDAERICAYIAFIVGGKITAEGTVSALMANASIGHTIQLSADANIEDFTDDLHTHFGECKVQTKPDHTVTLVSTQRIALSPILQYLDSKGVSVYEVKELRPSLEDVFVTVTSIEAAKLKKEKAVPLIDFCLLQSA